MWFDVLGLFLVDSELLAVSGINAEVAAMRAVRQVEARHQHQLREMEAQLLQAANSASASELRVMLARRKIVEDILTLHCQRAGCGAAIFDWCGSASACVRVFVCSCVRVFVCSCVRVFVC